MTTETSEKTETVETGTRQRAMLGLAVALVAGVGLATLLWTTGLVDGEYVADLQDKLDTAQTGPGVVVAMLIALAIGASMVALPCGFPAVFMVPAILEHEEHTAGRLRSLAAFASGGVVPLAVAGCCWAWPETGSGSCSVRHSRARSSPPSPTPCSGRARSSTRSTSSASFISRGPSSA